LVLGVFFSYSTLLTRFFFFLSLFSPAAVRPFLLALVVLAAAWAVIRRTWVENSLVDLVPGMAVPTLGGFKPISVTTPLPLPLPRPIVASDCFSSLRPIVRNRKIWMLSLVQAFFESSIYLFVFAWTPSLVCLQLQKPKKPKKKPPNFLFPLFTLSIRFVDYAKQTKITPTDYCVMTS
jgi:hypothetical protein